MIESSVWKATQHAGLLEDGAGLELEIDRLELAARASIEDDRAGTLARGDLVGDLPAFADVVQHDAKAELLGESQHGDDVVVAVRVVVHDALAREHLAADASIARSRAGFLSAAIVGIAHACRGSPAP